MVGFGERSPRLQLIRQRLRSARSCRFGRFAVILRVLAIQRNMTSVRQVLAVRIAFVTHEVRPIEVALSRLGTPISSI